MTVKLNDLYGAFDGHGGATAKEHAEWATKELADPGPILRNPEVVYIIKVFKQMAERLVEANNAC